MTQAQPRYGALQLSIMVLTVATAVIHFILAFDWLFVANGLGYLVLLGALYLPVRGLAPYRNLVRWLLLAYTAVTVLLWVSMPGARTPIAWIDKTIEVLLIVLLWMESQSVRR